VLAQLAEGFFTTKPQGTGLGLAVVRAVARAHGGEFEIRSAPGQGTVASLLLPVREAHAATAGLRHA
jgi:two-component system, sensor histidine kinase FlrB